MNTLVIVLIAAVCLLGGYTLYGRWLAKTWGIDPKAKPPLIPMKTDRIMFLRMDGPCLPINFRPSQEPAL